MFKLKIWLAILAPFSGVTPFFYKETKYVPINAALINEGIERVSNKEDPTNPGFQIDYNSNVHASVASTGGNNKPKEKTNITTKSINSKNYAIDKSDFLKKYNYIEVAWSSSWSSSGFGINKSYSGTKNIALSSSSQTVTLASENIKGFVNKASFYSNFYYYWSGDYLYFDFISHASIYRGGNMDYVESATDLKIKNIKFTSSFNFDTTFNNLDKGLGKGQRDKGSGYSNASSNPGTVIKIESDYSPNVLDERNWSQIEKKVKEGILKALGDTNNEKGWIEFLNPTFSLSNDNLYVVTTFKNINNHKTNKKENWKFSSRLDFKLSEKYLTEKVFERIEFLPGKVINENGINLVDDIEEVIKEGAGKNFKYNNGKIRYHSNTSFFFSEAKQNANDPDYDLVKVNGKTLNSVNGFYSYFLDGIEGAIDENPSYLLEIDHKKNPNIPLDEEIKYKVEIEVSTKTPPLQLKLMNWSKNNIDFDRLTNPTKKDANGKEIPNPDYDKDISVETGTKKQIIWVKNKSNYAFPLDPISKEGEILEFDDIENYDYGYIAEASAGGAGFNNFWDSEEVEEVNRFLSNQQLKTNFINPHKVLKNDPEDLNTTSGFYHFVIKQKTNPGWIGNQIPPKYNQKFFYVDKEKDNNYDYFLNSVQEESATNFWTTVHGIHLKNYMINYRGWGDNNTNEFSQLSFENIMSFWNDYVSAIRSKKAVDQTPNNLKSLKDFDVSDLIFNEQNSTTLKNSIISSISEKLKKQGYTGEYPDDWEFEILNDENGKWEKKTSILDEIAKQISFTDEEIEQINNGEKAIIHSINLRISASGQSIKLTEESKQFKVWNRSDMPENIFDLDALPLLDQKYDFREQNSENILESYILEYIKLSLDLFDFTELVNGKDYKVSLSGFNGDEVIKEKNKIDEFLEKSRKGEIATLKISVYAVITAENSPLIQGIKSYSLINDPTGEISPEKPVPPVKPDEDHENKNKQEFNKMNLIWIIPLVVLTVGLTALIIFRVWDKRAIKRTAKKRKKRLK